MLHIYIYIVPSSTFKATNSIGQLTGQTRSMSCAKAGFPGKINVLVNFSKLKMFRKIQATNNSQRDNTCVGQALFISLCAATDTDNHR